MLCDMFAEMRGMKEFRSLPAYIRTSVEVLGDKVASAPRFILDRSATQMIQSLSPSYSREVLISAVLD